MSFKSLKQLEEFLEQAERILTRVTKRQVHITVDIEGDDDEIFQKNAEAGDNFHEDGRSSADVRPVSPGAG